MGHAQTLALRDFPRNYRYLQWMGNFFLLALTHAQEDEFTPTRVVEPLENKPTPASVGESPFVNTRTRTPLPNIREQSNQLHGEPEVMREASDEALAVQRDASEGRPMTLRSGGDSNHHDHIGRGGRRGHHHYHDNNPWSGSCTYSLHWNWPYFSINIKPL